MAAASGLERGLRLGRVARRLAENELLDGAAGARHLFAATSAQLGVESQLLLRLRQPALVAIDVAEAIVAHLRAWLKLNDFAKLGRGLFLLAARRIEGAELEQRLVQMRRQLHCALRK